MGIKEDNKQQIAEFKEIVAGASIDLNDKKVLVVPVDPFNAARDKAGVTDEELVKVRQFSSNYIAAAHEVAGMKAVDALKKDKELDSVSIDISLGEFGSAQSKVNRVHVGVAPGTKDEVSTYGTNNTRVTIMKGTAASGINAARDAIKEYAAKKLGK